MQKRAMAAALYGAHRERIAIHTASGAVNIRDTYKDVVEFDAEGSNCLVCSDLCCLTTQSLSARLCRRRRRRRRQSASFRLRGGCKPRCEKGCHRTRLNNSPLFQSAFKNNIDLRKDVAELLEARMKRANEKRSATAALANAAKNHAAAPAAAAAAGSDAAANAVPVVVDGNAPDDDDDAVLEDWAQATSVELPPVPAAIDERATYRWDDGTCINMLFPEPSADAS
jgi:hypothetical protein